MEEVTEEIVRLSGFAPLIQLWAGICLLFFYEILLDKFPLEKSRTDMKTLFDQFAANYQGYMDSEKIPKFDSFQGTKWEVSFVPTIRNMAGLSFFYSIFILACIGIENTLMFKERLTAIQGTNIAVWIYMLTAALFTGKRVFHTYWTCTIFFFLLLVYFHMFPSLNSWMVNNGWTLGKPMTVSHTTVITLFTCASPLPLVIIHLFYDWVLFWKRKRNLEEINKNFALMTSAMVGIAKPADFPKKLQKKILKKMKAAFLGTGVVKVNDLNDYLTEEIKEEFDAFTSSRIERCWRKWGFSQEFQKCIKAAIKKIVEPFFLLKNVMKNDFD